MNHRKSRDNMKKFESCHPKICTNVYLTVTSASDTMSVYNTDDGLVLTRAPIDTNKPSY